MKLVSPCLAIITWVMSTVPLLATHTYSSEDVTLLVQGRNGFAVDLYKALKATKGNVVFSPYSISTALAMTYPGARGETKNQMARTLHIDPGQPRLLTSYHALEEAITHGCKRPNCQLDIANSLWIDTQTNLLQGFLDASALYRASVKRVDFRTAPETARRNINTWVQANTNGKIKNLLQPGSVDPATRLILVNAVYFQDRWQSGFDPRMTRKEVFTTRDGQKVSTHMMTTLGTFSYTEKKDVHVLELPYEGKRMSMLVVLPRTVDGIDQLEASLDLDCITQWTSDLIEQNVKVYLPKVTMTFDCELTHTLGAMGMPDAFSPEKADFSGIDGTRELAISAIFHKAFVDIGEEGTTAAAATGVGMGITSLPAPPPVVFRADHPFLVLIRHNGTGCILFMGRVDNPNG